MLPLPLPFAAHPHPLVPQLRGGERLQLYPVQVVPRGGVQLVSLWGASTPHIPSSWWQKWCPTRNTQGHANSSASSHSNTEYNFTCLRMSMPFQPLHTLQVDL